MKNEFVAVYITTKNPRSARKIGKILVKERLAGCINIIPYVNSMYWWKGRIEDHGESVIIAKTRRSLIKKLIEVVKKHHSYKVPCINALPILEGNPDYLKWLKEETRLRRDRGVKQ